MFSLPTEEDNCQLVEVTETEVKNSVNSMPKLDTLILVKSMIKNHSFQNPFRETFQRNGRSNSAPEDYDCMHNDRYPLFNPIQQGRAFWASILDNI